MSLGRPWEKQYRNLLAEVEQRWGKKLHGADYAKMDEERWSNLDPTWYPSFRGRRDGDLIDISLKMDTLELSVCVPVGALILIRPEGFVDRLFKRIMFWWEFQTGNPAFDRKYYIEDIRNEADKSLVRDPQFQRLMGELEPFLLVSLGEKSARLSCEIEGESQFTLGYIDERLGSLSRLAKHAAEVLYSRRQ